MVSWTTADEIAYLARQRPKQSAPAQGCDDEAELHRQILDECRRRGWMTFHGAMAHRTFRVPGEPDFIIIQDTGKLLMVEAKTRTGKLSTDQQAVHAWAARLSHKIHTVRSYEEFLNLLTTNDNERMPAANPVSNP
jgi:Holliday junction resolvase-like predicted endonuclease